MGMAADPRKLIIRAEHYRRLAQRADEHARPALIKQAEVLETMAVELMARKGGAMSGRSFIRQLIWVLVGLIAVGIIALMVTTPRPPKGASTAWPAWVWPVGTQSG